MGYGIIKSTSPSREASPHLSQGSQIAQVTSRSLLHTHDPHPRCAQTAAQLLSSPPGAPGCVQFSLFLFVGVGVTAAWIWAAILLRSPFIFSCRAGWNSLLGSVQKKRRKKKKHSGNESCNTILRVPNVSLSRDKGPEKSCWAYFSLQMIQEWWGRKDGGVRGGGEGEREGKNYYGWGIKIWSGDVVK